MCGWGRWFDNFTYKESMHHRISQLLYFNYLKLILNLNNNAMKVFLIFRFELSRPYFIHKWSIISYASISIRSLIYSKHIKLRHFFTVLYLKPRSSIRLEYFNLSSFYLYWIRSVPSSVLDRISLFSLSLVEVETSSRIWVITDSSTFVMQPQYWNCFLVTVKGWLVQIPKFKYKYKEICVSM